MKIKALLLTAVGLIFMSTIQAATFTVTNTADSGPGSFRQAVLDANALAGADVINFNIGGGGAQTITLSSTVTITQEVFVDGSSQPLFAGTPLITITGNDAIQINGGSNSTIQWLDISSTASNPIRLINSSGVSILNNNLSGSTHSVRADGNNTNVVISNNNCSGTTSHSIYLVGGTNNGWTITGNNITNSAGWGVYYASGTPTDVSGNDFTGCNSALYLVGANTFTLSAPGSGGVNENTYGGHTQTIQLNACTNMNVSGWDFTATNNPGLTPFQIVNTSNSVFDSNIMTGMAHALRADGNNSNITFTNNTGNNCTSHAIYLVGGTNNGWTITGNNITNSAGWGVHYANGTPTDLSGNDFTGCNSGLYLVGANTFTLSAPGSGGVNENTFGGHTQTIQLNACTNMNVSGWDFTATNNAGLTPFQIVNTSNSVFDSNIMTGMAHALRADGNNSNITFTNNTGNNCTSHAIYQVGGTNNGWTITGNNITNSAGWGVHYANGTPTDISGNDFTGCNSGLYLVGANTFTLGSNIYLDAAGTGISLNACTSVTINNAEVTATGGTGVLLTNSSSCNIDGTIACGRQYGIRLSGTCNNNNITNSQIANSTSDGIRIDAGTISNTIIDQSDFFSNTNDILDNGTGTTISNSTTLTSAPFCPCVDPVDQTVTAASTQLCPTNTGTTIDLGSSETGFNYYLRDDSDDSVIDGPIAGTGSSITFNTGALASSTSFNAYALNDAADGFAVDMPASDDYIRFSTPNTSYSNALTVEAWVDFNNGEHAWAGQSSPAVDNMGTNVWLWHAGTFYVNDNGTWRSLGFPSLPTGWTHVATVADASGLYIYYDGVLVASNGSGITSGIVNNASSEIHLGHDVRYAAGTAGRNTQTTFDEFRVWNTAKPQSEISANMNSCLSGSETGLVQYTLFGEGTGTNITSVTGSSATLENPTTNWVFRSGSCVECSLEMSTLITINVGDAVAPVADVATLSDLTDECSVSAPTAPTATDDCEGAITGTTTTTFPITAQGTTVVTWTYDDGNGNTSTQTQNVIINDVTAPVPDVATLADATGECSVTVTAPTATDNCAGTITATTTDPLTYSVQGTYTITWTYDDGNGNTSSQNQTVIVDDVTAPTPDVATLADATGECSVTVTAPTATDNCDGPVTATTTDPLTYSSQGTYMITWTYTDAQGNTSTQTQNVIVDDITDPTITAPADVTVSANAVNCSATGVTLGTPTSADNCNVASVTDDAPATFPLGTTTVTWTVTDDAGNTTTDTQIVTVTSDLGVSNVSTIDVDCNGANTGSIDITVGGGTTPYTFDWDNDGTGDNDDTEDLTGLAAGTYNGVVTDANGCTDGGSVTINEPTPIVITIDATTNPSNCGAADGAIDVTTTGGTPAYTFLWDDAALTTTEDIMGLTAGAYTLTVTDVNGCVESASASLSDPGGPTVVIDSTTAILCGGDSTGAVYTTVTGGTAPILIDWDNDGTGDNDDMDDITMLVGGTYNMVVTDANNCVASVSQVLTAPDTLTLAGGVTNVTCNGDADGAIDIVVGGGTVAGAYTFDWDNDGTGDNDDTEDLSGLSGDTLIVIVMDDNMCVVTDTFIVAEPDSLVGTTVGTDEIAGNDGAIDLTVTGGTSPYTYQWDDAANSTTEDLSGLVAGTYTVIITDANGCSDTIVTTIGSQVGLASFDAINVSLYPNPNKGAFNLQFDRHIDGQIIIVDAAGRLIFDRNVSSNSTEIQLEDVETGLYNAIIITESGKSIIRFIIE